ncbi:MAG: hypothetical protein HC881_14605 [Leptolyngbyaceae cyanobacterium SL_7_1]|nr:hypothetical protein [Leptolyngbyaceae cyanobacterium SL_7_1]
MPLTVPAELSFEQAIALTQALLVRLSQNQLTDAETESYIAALVNSETGARGFFVTYLTGEASPADRPTDAVIQALRTSPEIVSELLVKNLAMSTAMAIAHYRQRHLSMAEGSERVRSRTMGLLQRLQLPLINQKLQSLRETARTGEGDYQSFLSRWGYDAEQQEAIATTITSLLGFL